MCPVTSLGSTIRTIAQIHLEEQHRCRVVRFVGRRGIDVGDRSGEAEKLHGARVWPIGAVPANRRNDRRLWVADADARGRGFGWRRGEAVRRIARSDHRVSSRDGSGTGSQVEQDAESGLGRRGCAVGARFRWSCRRTGESRRGLRRERCADTHGTLLPDDPYPVVRDRRRQSPCRSPAYMVATPKPAESQRRKPAAGSRVSRREKGSGCGRSRSFRRIDRELYGDATCHS